MNIADLTSAVNNRKRAGKTVTDEQLIIVVVGLTDSNKGYEEIGKRAELNKNTVWTIRKAVTTADKKTMDRIVSLKIAENFEELNKKYFPAK